MKVDRVTSSMLSIAVAGIFTILLTMQGYGVAGGAILVGTGMTILMFVLQESLVSFTKGTEIELATRSLFAIAAIIVGLYNLI